MERLGLFFAAAALASAAPSPDFGKLPLHFEENRGQTDARVRYLARAADRTLFLTADGAVLNGKSGAVRLRFRGANRDAATAGVDRQTGVSNYLGRRTLAGVAQFARVRYRGVWPGIDVVFYGTAGEIEYDFVIAPGADPRRIRLRFDGVKGLRMEGGDLVAGGLRQRAPRVYQGNRLVSGGYRIRGREVAFTLGEYDRTRELVIDPVLVYNARFGARAVSPINGIGSGLNGLDRGGTAIAVDSAGNAYVAGSAYTADFPSTPGVFQPALKTPAGASNGFGPNDVFLMKLNASGSALIYSTFLGGSGDDIATGMALDSDGNVYVTGTTTSSDFPVTPDALFPKYPLPGVMSGFVAKINPDATKLLYCTYLGSTTGATDARAIAIDSARNMYVTGTAFNGFPTTPGAYRTAPGQGAALGWVAKINAAGTALVYSTYLGGVVGSFGAAPPPLAAMSIAVDSAGNAIVSGETNDRNFPATVGAFQTGFRGANTQTGGFVTKLNANGSGLVFSTYLAGSFLSGVDAMAVGPDGSIYLTGHTADVDFPTTPGAFMTAPNPEFPPNFVRYPPYGFVTRMKPDGSGLIYSTYIGGGGAIIMGAIAVDSAGDAVVFGAADATSFPTTPGAIQPCLGDPNGFSNAILFKLDPNGAHLLYSTFLGGNVRDQGFGITLDNSGDAYVTGMSDSTNFVTTPGAAGIPTGQAFIAKIAFSAPTPATGVTCVANTASMVPGPVAAGEIVSIFGTGLGPATPQSGTVANGAFPTSVSGTRVLFDGVAAPILMVSANQINAIVPSPVRFRAQTAMQVEVNGKALPAQTLDVALTSPAIFTLNGTGTGMAAALNQDGTLNSPANPALRGSFVTLFVNSPLTWQPFEGDGLVLTDAHGQFQGSVVVTTNNINTGAVYVGNSPGSVTALWQLNVLVPLNLPSSGTIAVKVGGSSGTQRVTIAVR